MLKKEIVRAPVLAYYNPQKETILQTDASTKHLGAKITRLCDELRSYIITTEEGTHYRKTQTHLKLYLPWYQTTKQELKLNRHTQCNNNQI